MMKTILKISIILLLFPIISLGQDGGINYRDAMISPSANFHEISQKNNAYYSANPDSAEGGSYAQFKRWEMFWQNRVDKPNATIGSFTHAQEALNSLMSNPVCNNSSYSSWKLLGPKTNMPGGSSWPNIGRVMSVASDPINSNIIYAGSEAGGVFKTTNGLSGNPIWTNITNSLRLPGMGINDIKIDPTNSQIIYIATGNSASGGYGIGILKSTNGGANWTSISPISPSVGQIARKIAINPINPNIVYALVNDAVYKTTDGGSNWSNVFTLPNSIGQVAYDPNLIARHLFDIEIHPTNPNIVYIASNDHAGALSGYYSPSQNQYGGNDGLLMYKTTDGFTTAPSLVNIANTATSEIPSIRMSIAITPSEPNSVFAIFKNYTNSQFATNADFNFINQQIWELHGILYPLRIA